MTTYNFITPTQPFLPIIHSLLRDVVSTTSCRNSGILNKSHQTCSSEIAEGHV